MVLVSKLEVMRSAEWIPWHRNNLLNWHEFKLKKKEEKKSESERMKSTTLTYLQAEESSQWPYTLKHAVQDEDY